ncbi:MULTISPECIES: S41 family peptidase [Niallia]|uniref:C-terminal processing peptidase n=1 Tax=Niallia circulans TaxID=1397 RepID=A0A268FCV5_NIACI|nr:S41 family peptidase [Niallia circulans]AYV69952.1 PDZ domain-containing protein [Niallia circulans]AYV74866.1 PDZ domain-containing protein [Niallia circulans]PAD83191.1 peptidase S41 [Niallia circulans]QJX64936.1 PDZ domain-containing protein [Niallia circulans]UQZ77678.1 PDZ domain-containing protein [Niallia circulans]
MNRKWLAIYMAGSLLAGSGMTYIGINMLEKRQEEQLNNQTMEAGSLDKLDKAYQIILQNYVENVDKQKLEDGAIRGMLATLEDPYSVYMDQEAAKQFEQALDSSFEGIGAEISIEEDKMIIVSPIKGSPAEKAGIKAQDQIISVNGENVEGKDLNDVIGQIRGEKGSKVELEIKRATVDKPLKMEIVRDEVPQITVYSDIKKDGGEKIGYIEITSFSKDTASEFEKELNKLEKNGISSLILDVRGNPGGLLTSVNAIVEQFLTNKKPYVQVENRNGDREQFYSDLKKQKEYPVVVLIDNGSASASEILAAALKEGAGYPLIGENSFGKGTVQQPILMDDGSEIKLTVSKWLTPDGNWIHKQGIKPTIDVEQTDLYHTHPLQIVDSLKLEDNDEQVQYAQEILTSLGFTTDRQDGYYSPQTEVAVRAFQSKNALEVTGVIDGKTAAKLEEAVRTEKQKDENDIQLQTAIRYLVH